MRKRKLAGIATMLLLVLAIAIVGRRVAAYIPAFAAWVEALGPRGAMYFMAGYVLAVVLLVPGSILTLAAGAIFGLVRGTLYVFLAASAGATLAFLIARHFARAAVARRIEGRRWFSAIDEAVAREGRKIAFLIRLSPLFPFSATNYALGLTSIRLTDYLIACIGMLPGTLLYVYYGHVAGDVAAAAAGGAERGAGYWIVMLVGLGATIAVTTVITRAARRALNESIPYTEQGDEP